MDEDLLEVRIASVDNWFLVTVHGEIDASTVITFRAALEQVPASDTVVVNLANVRFLDSSGLGVLATQTRRLCEGGGSLEVLHASAAVRRVVEVAGLGALIETSDVLTSTIDYGRV